MIEKPLRSHLGLFPVVLCFSLRCKIRVECTHADLRWISGDIERVFVPRRFVVYAYQIAVAQDERKTPEGSSIFVGHPTLPSATIIADIARTRNWEGFAPLAIALYSSRNPLN
jgi:hypothetical protein